MRIGIISDTHDRIERTRSAVQLLVSEGAEVLIHCGDLTSPDMVRLCAVLPSFFVFGNNDVGYTDEIQSVIGEIDDANCLGWKAEIQQGGKRIAIAHGHRFQDMNQLLSTKPDYLLSGHSHIQHDRRVGETRHINPGALHRAAFYSVALLEPETDTLRFLPVPS